MTTDQTPPRIDTQASGLNIVFGRNNSELPQGWTLHLGDGAVHYREGNSASSYGLEQGLRAYLAALGDLSAAREAAAWIAGRDAVVKQAKQIVVFREARGDECGYDNIITGAQDVIDATKTLTIPADLSAALDRLIAEARRDVWDQAMRTVRQYQDEWPGSAILGDMEAYAERDSKGSAVMDDWIMRRDD